MAGLLAISRITRALADTPAPRINALGGRLLANALQPMTETIPFPRFELYIDKAMEWRWRYRASNYKIIADSGEGYKNYSDAEYAVRLMQKCFDSPIHIGTD